jgi:hypothetical protein
MTEELNADEREVVKLVGFFKKRAERMISENKLDPNYVQLIETCDKFVEQLHAHAHKRNLILQNRDALKNLVKDNARCPHCESNEMLKLIGTDTNEQGLTSNKYKCRRCNISFVWNAPNNPKDMVTYVEQVSAELEKKMDEMDEEGRAQVTAALEQMRGNIDKLKPVVLALEQDVAELEARDREMNELVNKFKKHLMIEKIKMDI